jgi:hypothetical protein
MEVSVYLQAPAALRLGNDPTESVE